MKPSVRMFANKFCCFSAASKTEPNKIPNVSHDSVAEVGFWMIDDVFRNNTFIYYHTFFPAAYRDEDRRDWMPCLNGLVSNCVLKEKN